MSLFHCGKPVVCKVHGFCVAGGTDMALCSDLLVIAQDAKIGYPPARVWGSPTTALWAHRVGAQRAKRLLFTGDSLSGAEAVEWGLAIEAPPAEQLDERTEILLERIARMPRQPADDDEAAGQPDAVRAGPARHARCSARCSTASRVTPPRATPSSSTPPSRAFARRCASATSRSATPAARPSRAEGSAGSRFVRDRFAMADEVASRLRHRGRLRRAAGLWPAMRCVLPVLLAGGPGATMPRSRGCSSAG